MKPGRLLDASFAYVFSDESDSMPSPHGPVNGASSFVRSLRLGYGVVKTLNYVNEPRDIDSINTNSQCNVGISPELSPRKHRAHGMFTDDGSIEVIVQPEQTKQTDNSITPTPERHNTAQDKGIYVSNVK